MSIKIFAEGFIPDQPPLQQVGQTVKCEFDVCAKRSVKKRDDSGFEDVHEYVTFVAWGEEAEKLSDLLVPGREVSAIGIQETSRWVDRTTQEKRSRKVYKLIHLEIKRRAPNQQGQGQNHGQGRAAPGNQNQSRQRQDYPQSNSSDGGGYDHGHDDHSPEPQFRRPTQEPRQQGPRISEGNGNQGQERIQHESRFSTVY